ncbi:MAG: GNAT family N-acetyltransferase [Streptococcus peroris]|uniref:GNAT family N-acetyltransferase n=1 Tax=Streptococcus peroris TaxID=68891 RepID=UPI00290E3DE8|nr:GNAT family N-acetyltransferase [Streptococcus peroris]MDU7074236.1 GNAT family N-acetyltransferase [Streptococcus peroris]
MNIHFEKGLQLENAQVICRWSNALGESFQKQWMGPKISYPLIVQSLQKMEGIFSIFAEEEFVGVIQKIKLEDKNLHVGRFLIAPHRQGKGLGRKAFQYFLQKMFENEEIESISLTVFESNPIAKKLYQKEGFKVVQTIENPERKFIMKKVR